ncbi:hypothetical protein IscW_ISCW011423 [Ixodes scapularis]|uniref:Uncharacterized protein n=1 Tax=Ixodes scapularis TaxID=6945 RepID=B7Q5Z5_IXOSC|nr:hypothetical protein IscW_ISCW011423 [Ixodes scapularis]|eukprot:XP_002411847.1 hypothetical protein IscW_ISCW011423 [Ixodes scapularis]
MVTLYNVCFAFLYSVPFQPKKFEPVPMIDDLDDSFEEHSNDENDPDWAGSPMFPQTNRKRKSRDEDLPEMKVSCCCQSIVDVER